MTPLELKDSIEKFENLRKQKDTLENDLHHHLKERIIALNRRYYIAFSKALAAFPPYAIYTTCYNQRVYEAGKYDHISIGTPEENYFIAVLSYNDRDGETFMWEIEIPFDEADDDKFIEDFKSDCIREFTIIYKQKKADEKKNAESEIKDAKKRIAELEAKLGI